MLKLGNKSISDLFIGQKAATKAFLGQKLVWQKATGLPYDAEVEYLESTGTQWIDTRIYPSSSMSVEVMYKISSAQLNTCIFSARTSATSNSFSIWNDINGHYRFDYTASGADNKDGPSSIVGSYVTLKKDGNRNYVNGIETAANTAKTFSCVQTAYLFAMNNGGVADFFVSAMCASCKIWQDGVLVRDFVPVRKGGVGYMYDRVSKQLFGNQGSGNFVVGPDVVEVEYLESTGTQYIDTGIALSNASLADIKWVVEVTNFNDGCMGVYGQSQTASMYVNFYANKFYMRNMRTSGGSFDGVSGFNTIRFSSGTSYLNGTAVETDIPLNTNPTNSMFLFAYNRSNVAQGFCKARVQSFTVKVSDVLIADFIPVRVGMEGAMKDKVTGKIYRNAGTGAFKIGADRKETPLMCNSYVKDGLIAMWDGTENAGWGIHDASATTWKDLTGNHVLSYEFTPSFTNNAFELPGTDKVAYCESNLWRDAVNANQCTVEICFKGYSVGGNNSIIALSRGTTSNVERAWWQWSNVALGYRLSTGSTWSNDTLLPRGETDDVSLSFPLADMYMNGTKVMTGSPGTLNIQSNTLVIGRIGTFKSTINEFVTMRADIHSIRIYNKVLTAEEIAANYEIDKRRFNLT